MNSRLPGHTGNIQNESCGRALDLERKRDYLTPAECAARLAVHERTILRLIKSGTLKACRVRTLWRIAEADFRAYIEVHSTGAVALSPASKTGQRRLRTLAGKTS
jgi:excisionase family DNA binding protein